VTPTDEVEKSHVTQALQLLADFGLDWHTRLQA
jgi:hypothetical protein